MKTGKSVPGTQTVKPVRCSDWLDIVIKHALLHDTPVIVRRLLKPVAYCLLKSMQFKINCRLLFHKALYRVMLRTQRLGLPLHRIRMRRRLIDTECQFIAKHGSDWRLCVFDNDVVQFLQFSKYVHGATMSNDKSSATGHEGEE